MKIEEPTQIQKLKTQLHALRWFANNLKVPLENGEKILFEMIIDNMTKLLEDK